MTADDIAKGRALAFTVRHADESTETERMGFGADCWHLVDGETVVWSDQMEPEDAILPRDLGDLVRMLNEERTAALDHIGTVEADRAKWHTEWAGEFERSESLEAEVKRLRALVEETFYEGCLEGRSGEWGKSDAKEALG